MTGYWVVTQKVSGEVLLAAPLCCAVQGLRLVGMVICPAGRRDRLALRNLPALGCFCRGLETTCVIDVWYIITVDLVLSYFILFVLFYCYCIFIIVVTWFLLLLLLLLSILSCMYFTMLTVTVRYHSRYMPYSIQYIHRAAIQGRPRLTLRPNHANEKWKPSP